MSVWKRPHYLGEVIARIANGVPLELLSTPRFARATTFTTSGSTASGGNFAPGPVLPQIIKSPLCLSEFLDPSRIHIDPILVALCTHAHDIRTGIEGVYHFLQNTQHLWTAAPSTEAAIAGPHYNAIRFGLLASYRTPSDCARIAADYSASFFRCFNRARAFTSALSQIQPYSRKNTYRHNYTIYSDGSKVIPEIPFKSPHFSLYLEARFYKGLFFIKHVMSGVTYIFNNGDIDRINRTVEGLQMSEFYLENYADRRATIGRKMHRIHLEVKKHLMNAFATCTSENAWKICKAFDIMYNLCIASMACDVDDKALKLQSAKIRDLDGPVNWQEVLALIKTLQLDEQLEQLSIYKALPVSDFDALGQMDRQQKLYREQDNWPYRTILGTKNTYDDIIHTYRWLMIKCYHAKHGVCPGELRDDAPVRVYGSSWAQKYPTIRPEKIPHNEAQYIDFRGAFQSSLREEDLLDLVKDKTVCPPNIAASWTARDIRMVSQEKRSHLLAAMLDEDRISLEDLRSNFGALPKDVMCEDKPEAKKQHGRVFIEAQSRVRLVLQEYEENVTHYAKEHGSFISGKSNRQAAKAFNHVFEMTGALSGAPTRDITLSFDLDKFSPGLDVDIHRRIDALWAEAFDLPCLANAWTYLTDGEMHYSKFNFHHHFQKVGKDFEGQAGKRLTLYHIAVMQTAVREIAQDPVLKDSLAAPARFATMIDDGLLRLSFNPGVSNEEVHAVINRIETVYNCGCLKISWDKTFVSEVIGVFLHNLRYANNTVCTGLKAFLKIIDRSDDTIRSLYSDQQTVEATCRAALTVGVNDNIVYAAYVHLSLGLCERQIGTALPTLDSLLPWLFTAPGLGGLGLRSALQLAGALATDITKESVALLKFMAVKFPKTVSHINRIINQPKRKLTVEDMLRNPTRIRREGPVLDNGRAAAVLRRAFERRYEGRVNALVLRGRKVPDMDVTMDPRQMVTGCSADLFSKIYACSLQNAMSILQTKVMNSRTVLFLVGGRQAARASMSNHYSATNVVKRWTG